MILVTTVEAIEALLRYRRRPTPRSRAGDRRLYHFLAMTQVGLVLVNI